MEFHSGATGSKRVYFRISYYKAPTSEFDGR